jgi:hypothetical protein
MFAPPAEALMRAYLQEQKIFRIEQGKGKKNGGAPRRPVVMPDPDVCDDMQSMLFQISLEAPRLVSGS